MSEDATRPLATVNVRSLGDALQPDVLQALPAESLIRFLSKQRWFGAKGRTPEGARVLDTVPLPWSGGAFTIAQVEVDIAGRSQRYQVPLAVRPGDVSHLSRAARAASLCGVAAGTEVGFVFDAVHDPIFLRGLADAFANGERFTGAHGTQFVVETTSELPFAVPHGAPITLGAAEQSNTSIVFNRQAILKLFRRLEPGEHPDVEMTRYLTTQAAFPYTPVLLGTLRLEHGDGTATIAGMLQEYLVGSRDAWSYTLDRGRAFVDESGNSFAKDAARLGIVTRDLHQVLAAGTAPAFAAERATAQDVARWAAGAREWVGTALDLLERAIANGTIPGDQVARGREVLARRTSYEGLIPHLATRIGDDAGLRIRTHGDYHLGQVLRTAGHDFMIIDFEGEPARPLAERREKTSALRDVAGMLRSFAYAAATLRVESTSDLPADVLDTRAKRWEDEVRKAFLDAYHGPIGTQSPIMPQRHQARLYLQTLFETEKLFYELAYELNNRPEWVWIPLAGVSGLIKFIQGDSGPGPAAP